MRHFVLNTELLKVKEVIKFSTSDIAFPLF